VGHDERRPIELLDDFRHREGLARTRYAKQYLMLFAVEQPARERLDGRALIALGLVAAD